MKCGRPWPGHCAGRCCGVDERAAEHSCILIDGMIACLRKQPLVSQNGNFAGLLCARVALGAASTRNPCAKFFSDEFDACEALFSSMFIAI